MVNASQSIWNFYWNSLHAPERQCIPTFDLFFPFTFSLIAVYVKDLMLECLNFSHTTGSLHYDGWMTLRLGCCVLLLSMLLMRKHRFCNALWLTIFCALSLYDFICDMETNLRMVRLMMELADNRSYTLPTAIGKQSRLQRLTNGVPQASVLASLLFNICCTPLTCQPPSPECMHTPTT